MGCKGLRWPLRDLKSGRAENRTFKLVQLKIEKQLEDSGWEIKKIDGVVDGLTNVIEVAAQKMTKSLIPHTLA